MKEAMHAAEISSTPKSPPRNIITAPIAESIPERAIFFVFLISAATDKVSAAGFAQTVRAHKRGADVAYVASADIAFASVAASRLFHLFRCLPVFGIVGIHFGGGGKIS